MQPVNSCCCGFALDTGIKMILGIHAALSVFYMGTASANIVFDTPTLGSGVSYATQIFNCGFSLAGVPFIVLGISGVKYGNETHLRLYLNWLIFSLGLDTLFVAAMVVQNTCAKLPGFLTARGGSFACGVSRIGSVVFVVLCLGIAFYLVFCVWSLCEDLKTIRSDRNFNVLIEEALAEEESRIAKIKGGLFGVGPAARAQYPLVYGAIDTPGIAGSVPIFGGTSHACEYPPKRHF